MRPYRPPTRPSKPQAVPARTYAGATASRGLLPAAVALALLVGVAYAGSLALNEMKQPGDRTSGDVAALSSPVAPATSAAPAAVTTRTTITGPATATAPTSAAVLPTSTPITVVSGPTPGAATSAPVSSGSSAPPSGPANALAPPVATSGVVPIGNVEVAGAQTSAQPFVAYEVQSGDTILSVASRYGVQAKSISVASGITDPDALTVGDLLTVPRVSGWLYRIQSGETLDYVASVYGVSVDLVRAANPTLTTNLPAVNTVVLVPYADTEIVPSK